MTDNLQWALGLMSGTSLDGIDAALVRTDGKVIAELGAWLTLPYDDGFREQMSHATQGVGDVALVERDFTLRSAQAVRQLLDEAGMTPEQVGVVGFHGQTIDHRPAKGITWQIGDGALLAAELGIDVVCDFRRRDVAEGGQGAPLVPLFHAAMAKALPRPLAVLNIGGVANVTFIDDEANSPWILAFDTGIGNALMNQWAQRVLNAPYDEGGALAAAGTPDATALEGYFHDTYFATPPPKSIDRYDFGIEPVLHLSDEDAMATLLEFTAQSVARAQDYFPAKPRQWLVCGGGVHNDTLMKRLGELLGNVSAATSVGWQPDALEAQAFAFLAVRSLRGLPLTLPHLTGGRRPVSGGAFYRGAAVARS